MAISVQVSVTGIPEAIPVQVSLPAICRLGTVVLLVVVAIPILVRVTGIAKTVAIHVKLGWVEEVEAVVENVGDPISIFVRVTEVTNAILILVSLLGIIENGAVVNPIWHIITIVILVDAIGDAIPIGIGKSLIGLAVTIIIKPVANFVGTWVDAGIQGNTILRIGDLVVIIVGVAKVTLAVQVEIFLRGVSYVLAVVDGVRYTITVLVTFQAISSAISVSIGIAFVGLAIAVVVQSVTNFGDGRIALTFQLPGNAFLKSRASAIIVCDVAGFFLYFLIHRTVAIVIQAIATLWQRSLGATFGQPVRFTLPLTNAGTKLVVGEA